MKETRCGDVQPPDQRCFTMRPTICFCFHKSYRKTEPSPRAMAHLSAGKLQVSGRLRCFP